MQKERQARSQTTNFLGFKPCLLSVFASPASALALSEEPPLLLTLLTLLVAVEVVVVAGVGVAGPSAGGSSLSAAEGVSGFSSGV